MLHETNAVIRAVVGNCDLNKSAWKEKQTKNKWSVDSNPIRAAVKIADRKRNGGKRKRYVSILTYCGTEWAENSKTTSFRLAGSNWDSSSLRMFFAKVWISFGWVGHRSITLHSIWLSVLKNEEGNQKAFHENALSVSAHLFLATAIP